MKYYIILLLVTISLGMSAQSDYLLRSSGNFYTNHIYYPDAGEDYYGPNYGFVTTNYNFSVSAGKKFKSNFYYGLGLSLQSNKDETNNTSLSFPKYSPYALFTKVTIKLLLYRQIRLS